MKLKMFERNVYGKIMIYCVEEAHEKMIVKLTGRKTLTDAEIEILKQMGVDVDVERLPKYR